MTNANAALILREFEQHRATRKAAKADKRWSWKPGVILFPEAICAWCFGAMRSNRIWLTGCQRLNGQVAIVAGRLVMEKPEHPHVQIGGAICMTSAKDSAQALFLSMSMAHSIWQNTYHDWDRRWKAWQVKVFDHDCTAARPHEGRSSRLSDELAEPVKIAS